MSRLKGKIAIVTGGARGIGAAFSEALAGEGASVVIADLLDGEAVVARIEASGGKAVYVRTDVADRTSVAGMVEKTVASFGGVDILVNNAAIFASIKKKPFTELEPDEWDKLMAVNVRGPFECARAVAPHMIAAKYGRIVNIASGTAFKGVTGMLHYVTSKGAVVAMTRCLARELGSHGITVNAIAPGLTMSEAIANDPAWSGDAAQPTVKSRALQRDQMPGDLTGALVYLASAESGFMTGQTMVVDGGAVMR
jgi:NAD(P)-dependent dehydrogenase (short-subunit alcohol dehydrogenase family)